MTPSRRAAVARVTAATLVMLVAASLYGAGASKGSNGNLYVYQADAFLHGRLDIQPCSSADDSLSDIVRVHGRCYVPFPPVPAIILLPVVAVLGASRTNVVVVSILLTGLNLVVLRRIFRILDVRPSVAGWITCGFFLGTAYWLCVQASGSVWFFAEVVAVTAMLLAIHEALGKGRGALAGLFLAAACLSRQMTIYSSVFLGMLLLDKRRGSTAVRQLLSFVAPLALCVSAYLWFNWVRFGDPFATGYSSILLKGFLKDRVDRYGLFHVAYVPFNFFYMFVQGVHLEFKPPTYLSVSGVDPFGTSLTFASPFVFAALWAKWSKQLLWSAWASILLAITHSMFYYNNGWVQQNAQRFSLDWLPIVIILVARGAERISPRLWKGAVAYSIGLNAAILVGNPLLRAVLGHGQ